MSDIKEDTDVSHHETTNEKFTSSSKDDGIKNQNVFSVALTNAIAKDNPSAWSKSMIQLYLIMILVTLTSTMNGYDGSLMGSLNAMDPFHTFFNVGMEGSSIGAVFAMYSVGQILGCLLAAPAADIMGRRFGMSAGSAFIIVGTIIQSATKTAGGFMGGRLLIGLGVTIVTTSAPVYLVELAYPSWRGIGGGLFNVCGWYVGALIASWTTYGTGHLTSDWSWRIPVIIQAIPASLSMFLVWTLPESPRWLIQHGKVETAHQVLVKFHGNGNPDSAVVKLEFDEITTSVTYAEELSTGQKWYDVRILVNSGPVLYRMWLVMLVSVFSQFIGGAVISYYMPVILENIGITSSSQQLLLNALNTVFSFLGGLAGSWTVDKFGRRPLFLWGTFLTGCIYVPINVIAAQADGHVKTGTGYAFIAMIFLYGIVWSFCWTPLQALYPAEILRNDIRVKGMAAQGLIGGLASFINTYATPVALANIGWKTYTIFLILHALQWLAMYLTVVETKGRSLEELEEIFEGPNKVKRSLKKKEVILKKGVGVKVELDSA